LPWPLLLTCFFTVAGSFGQAPLGRYYSDENRRSVKVGGTQFHGTFENGELRLSEREAIEMALKNNLDINIQRYSPISAKWAIKEVHSAYDPEAFFNFNWNRQVTPTTSILQGRESLTTVTTTGDSGVRKLFPTGTSAELYFNVRRDRSTSFFSTINPAINTDLGILLRQNLLRGFGKFQAEYQIEISRNNLSISKEEFRRSASDLILQVQQSYWDLRYAIEDVDVKQKSLDAARALLDQNRARYEAGTAARLDVSQSEAEFALREEELTRSKATRDILQDQLIRLISTYEDPREFPGTIVPDRPDDTFPPLESYAQLKQVALQKRPELLQNELEIENRQIGLESSRNELRPTLDLVAGYEHFGLGGINKIVDFSGGITDPVIIDIIPGGTRQSLHQLMSGRFYGYVVGVDLNIPLGNEGARARNAQAQIAYDRSMMGKRSLLQTVSLEIRDAMTRVQTSRASIQSSQAAVHAAEQRLDAEQARFEVGSGTTRDLIEAQRDLLVAASVLVRARTALAKSYAALDRAVGRSFERNGILLDRALNTNVVAP